MKPTTIIRRLQDLVDAINTLEYGDDAFVANDELLDLALHISEALDGIENVMSENDRSGVRAVTMAEFERMTDEELAKTIDPCWRGAFPGKECSHGARFYLHDGGWYDFTTGLAEGWRD